MLIVSTLVCLGDISSRRISNRLVAMLLLCSFVLVLSQGHLLASHLLALVLTFLIALVGFYTKVFGGGDAKLLTAFSLSLPLSLIDDALFLVAISGGLLAVFYLVKYRLLKLVPTDEILGLPYGLAISTGFYITILSYYL
ncbi:type IV prepilin peptidase TadV/CpaA [Vibrio variabilis]|uniref:Type IV prepilin peptidase TadV/CpaA n=1 Tax=Vibrio variabilis TaxID=990271 RepID=A0ABQ0JJA4_9VIBR|nr:type IV prepilin peptidase TadV/CpaA [Vibrio variabilis]